MKTNIEIMLDVCSDYFATLDVTMFPEDRRKEFAEWIRDNWNWRCSFPKFRAAFFGYFRCEVSSADLHTRRIFAQYNDAILAAAGY